MRPTTTVFFAFTLMASAVTSAAADSYNVDVGQSLDGRIIHIETLRFRAYWITSDLLTRTFFMTSLTVTPKLEEIPERDVYFKSKTQWRVTYDSSSGFVHLESVAEEHRYLKAWDYRYILLAYSAYPQGDDKMKWEIKCTGTDMENCRFRNKVYSDQYFDAYHDYYLQTTYKPEGLWAHFRILAPTPTESYQVVAQTTNALSEDVTKTLTFKQGISETTNQATEITSTVTTEVSAAYASVSGSLTYAWTAEESETFSQETSFTYDIPVPAGTTVYVKQMIGTYGIFTIKAQKILIDDEE